VSVSLAEQMTSQKKHPPAPFKGGTFLPLLPTTPCPPPPAPSKGGELGGGNFTYFLVCYAVKIVHDFVDLPFYGGGIGGRSCGFGGEDLVD